MSAATYNGVAVLRNSTDERDIRRIYMKGVIELDIELGDGQANVSTTRGFKTWFSTREAGMTVDSTVTISIACNRDQHTIESAAELVGGLTQVLAENGLNQLGYRIEDAPPEVRRGLSDQIKAGQAVEVEEPPRRSEKPKPGTRSRMPVRR